jgi:hypothetical protein
MLFEDLAQGVAQEFVVLYKEDTLFCRHNDGTPVCIWLYFTTKMPKRKATSYI